MVITTDFQGNMSVDKNSNAQPNQMFAVNTQIEDFPATVSDLHAVDVPSAVGLGLFGTATGFCFRRLADDALLASGGSLAAGGSIWIGPDYYGIVWTLGQTSFKIYVHNKDSLKKHGPVDLLACTPLAVPFTRAAQFIGVCPKSYCAIGSTVVEVFDSKLGFSSYPDFEYGQLDARNRLISAFGIETGTWSMDVVPRGSKGIIKSLLIGERGLPLGLKLPPQEGVYMADSTAGDRLAMALRDGQSLVGFDSVVKRYSLPPSGAYDNVGVLTFAVVPTKDVVDTLGSSIKTALFDLDTPGFNAALFNLCVGDEAYERFNLFTAVLSPASRLNAILSEYYGKFKELKAQAIKIVRETAMQAVSTGNLVVLNFTQQGLKFVQHTTNERAVADFTDRSILFADSHPEDYLTLDVKFDGTKIPAEIPESQLPSVFTQIIAQGRFAALPASMFSSEHLAKIKEAYEKYGQAFPDQAIHDYPNLTLVLDIPDLESYLKDSAVEKSNDIMRVISGVLHTIRGEAGGDVLAISNELPSGVKVVGGSVKPYREIYAYCKRRDWDEYNAFHDNDQINRLDDLYNYVYGADRFSVDTKNNAIVKVSGLDAMKKSRISGLRISRTSKGCSVSGDIHMDVAGAIFSCYAPVTLAPVALNVARASLHAYGGTQVTVTFKGFDASDGVISTSNKRWTWCHWGLRWVKASGEHANNVQSTRHSHWRPVYPMIVHFTAEFGVDTCIHLEDFSVPANHLVKATSEIGAVIGDGLQSLVGKAQHDALLWLIRSLEETGLLGKVTMLGLITPVAGANPEYHTVGALGALSNAALTDSQDVIKVLDDIIAAKDMSGLSPESVGATTSLMIGEGYASERDNLVRLRQSIIDFVAASHDKVWFQGGSLPIPLRTDWDLAGWYLKI